MALSFPGHLWPNHQFFRGVLVSISMLTLTLSGCGGGNGNGNSDIDDSDDGTEFSGSEPPFDSASGFAQKGPFQKGATVTIQPLDASGNPTGAGVSTSIGDWGEFQFENIDWTGPSLVTAEGFHFNESEGNYSGETISLSTVVEVDGQGNGFLGNINLLSHLMGQGIRHRMAGSDQPFADHVEAVSRQLRKDLGLILDPRELNLFDKGEGGLHQHESGMLATLSIGASFHDDLDGLLTLFNNAWEDGDLTDQFLDEGWQPLRDTVAEATLNGDYDQARQWLKDNFNNTGIAQPLESVGGVARIDACQLMTTTIQLPRVCIGHPQTSSLLPGDSVAYWFRAPYDGAFRFRTTGEMSINDTIVRLGRSLNDEDELGAALETKSRHDNGSVSTRILEKGDRVYIEVQAWTHASFTDPQEVTLSAHQQNEGSERYPARIFPQYAVNPYITGNRMLHFVGSQDGSEGDDANNQSFYRFISSGFSTLRYFEHACSNPSRNGYTYLTLYRSTTASNAFSDEKQVDLVTMGDHYENTGSCSIDIEVSPNTQYFMKVTSKGKVQNQFQSGSMYTRPDATGSATYSRPGRTVHFQGISD